MRAAILAALACCALYAAWAVAVVHHAAKVEAVASCTTDIECEQLTGEPVDLRPVR